MSLRCLLPLTFAAGVALSPAVAQHPSVAPEAARPAQRVGVPLSSAELTTVLPTNVFFRGQVAPVQARNAGGMRFRPGDLFFAVLVDSSGYSSGVQEVYQFYLVTEDTLLFGGKQLPAGAYGGGYLGDGTFVLMDVGGHPVLRGPVTQDPALARPRPLVVQTQTPTSVRLYLGRRYVEVAAGPPAQTPPVQ